MKKLQIELTQVSNKDKSLISQSSVKIRVNGQFIENDILKIADAVIEKNASVEYNITKYYNYGNYLKVIVTFKSGAYKDYTLQISGCNKLINTNENIDSIKKKLNNFKEFIQHIEDEVLDAHKYTNNYIIDM